jgi:putative endonuclease
MWWWRRKPEPLGKQGENKAARHLKRAGYRILERNVRTGRFEIDLIAQDGDTLCFVEVRTRSAVEPVSPEDTIQKTKRKHMIEAARRYIACHPDPGIYYRFDVVAVVWPENGKPEITLHKDAFHVDDEA